MLTNETISKLQDMRLGVMARQFKEQLDDPQFASMSFEDRLSKFKLDSDENMAAIKRSADSKRSGGYKRGR